MRRTQPSTEGAAASPKQTASSWETFTSGPQNNTLCRQHSGRMCWDHWDLPRGHLPAFCSGSLSSTMTSNKSHILVGPQVPPLCQWVGSEWSYERKWNGLISAFSYSTNIYHSRALAAPGAVKSSEKAKRSLPSRNRWQGNKVNTHTKKRYFQVITQAWENE